MKSAWGLLETEVSALLTWLRDEAAGAGRGAFFPLSSSSSLWLPGISVWTPNYSAMSSFPHRSCTQELSSHALPNHTLSHPFLKSWLRAA